MRPRYTMTLQFHFNSVASSHWITNPGNKTLVVYSVAVGRYGFDRVLRSVVTAFFPGFWG